MRSVIWVLAGSSSVDATYRRLFRAEFAIVLPPPPAQVLRSWTMAWYSIETASKNDEKEAWNPMALDTLQQINVQTRIMYMNAINITVQPCTVQYQQHTTATYKKHKQKHKRIQ